MAGGASRWLALTGFRQEDAPGSGPNSGSAAQVRGPGSGTGSRSPPLRLAGWLAWARAWQGTDPGWGHAPPPGPPRLLPLLPHSAPGRCAFPSRALSLLLAAARLLSLGSCAASRAVSWRFLRSGDGGSRFAESQGREQKGPRSVASLIPRASKRLPTLGLGGLGMLVIHAGHCLSN